MGNLAHDFVADELPELLYLLLVTTGAEIALLATEGDQVVVSAMVAMQPGKPAREIAAGSEGVERLGDHGTYGSVLLLEAKRVLLLECLPMV